MGYFPSDYRRGLDSATKVVTDAYNAKFADFVTAARVPSTKYQPANISVRSCRAAATRIACAVVLDPLPGFARMDIYLNGNLFRAGKTDTVQQYTQNKTLSVDGLMPGQEYAVAVTVLDLVSKQPTTLSAQGYNKALTKSFRPELASVKTTAQVDAGFESATEVWSSKVILTYKAREAVVAHATISSSDPVTHVKRVVAEAGRLKLDEWGLPDASQMKESDTLILSGLKPDQSYTYSLEYMSVDGRRVSHITEDPLVTKKTPELLAIAGPVGIQLTVGRELTISVPAKGSIDSAVMVMTYGKNSAGQDVSTRVKSEAKPPFKFVIPVTELVAKTDSAQKSQTGSASSPTTPPTIDVTLFGKNPEGGGSLTGQFAIVLTASMAQSSADSNTNKALKAIQVASKQGNGKVAWQDLLVAGFRLFFP